MSSLSASEVPVDAGVGDEVAGEASDEVGDGRRASTPPAPTDLLIKKLSGRYRVDRLREGERTRTYLDTSDRRLAGADLTVWFERSAQRLVLERRDGDQIVQEPVTTSWPARLEAVPEGSVATSIAKAVGIRALLPYVELVVHSTSYAVRNDEGKTVARLHRSRATNSDETQRDLVWPDRVDVERLRGYGDDADRVAKRLRINQDGGAARQWTSLIHSLPVPGQPAIGSAGRVPRMTLDQPAAVAIAGTLLNNLAEMEAAVDGILADLDIEYLHDFRVAVRRSRSVLKLVGDVLPEHVSAAATAELRWLGQVTTPGRDLDVYVAELPVLARGLARAADLEPFARHVQGKRKRAYASLRRSLRSQRFRRWCVTWRAELETVIDEQGGGDTARVTAAALADERVHKVFRKVARRANAIGPDSHSDAIHELRKACKELRYLLEMFKPLCDPATYGAVTADFKGLQDVLGDFQDGEVQAAALREFAEEMLRERTAEAATLLTMGELAAQFDERQRSARAKLIDHHMTHLGRSVARHIDHVVANRGAR